MTDNDIKSLWQHRSYDGDISKVSAQVRHAIGKFEKGIKIRDNAEIIVAVILIPVFSVVAYYVQPLLSRIGAFLTIPGVLIIVFTLRRVKQYRPVYGRLPLKEYLERYRLYMEKQMQLLMKVVWWYLLPCAIPITLFFIGQERYFFALLVLPFYFYVYRLNRWTAEHEIRPLIDQLDQEIAELDQS